MTGFGGEMTPLTKKSTTSGSETAIPVTRVLAITTNVVVSLSASTNMVTQACADALSRTAERMPLALPDSDLQVAAQEWEAFQDTLLNHVRLHQPGKCHGLLSQRACERCGEYPIRDRLAGKKLKQRMDAFIFTLGGKEEPDDGFDPSKWGDTTSDPVYDINQDAFARAHQSHAWGS